MSHFNDLFLTAYLAKPELYGPLMSNFLDLLNYPVSLLSDASSDKDRDRFLVLRS